MYQYAARVTAVHDADTIDVSIDCGFNLWLSTPVRLDGINAPELVTTVNGHRVLNEAGQDATDALLKLLGAANFAATRTSATFGIPGDYLALAGREPQVVITTRLDKDPDLDKYGRVLGVVTIPGQTVTVNDALLKSGHAVAYRP